MLNHIFRFNFRKYSPTERSYRFALAYISIASTSFFWISFNSLLLISVWLLLFLTYVCIAYETRAEPVPLRFCAGVLRCEAV